MKIAAGLDRPQGDLRPGTRVRRPGRGRPSQGLRGLRASSCATDGNQAPSAFPFINESASEPPGRRGRLPGLRLALDEIRPGIAGPPALLHARRDPVDRRAASRLYDDSYNSNPRALEAALMSLAALPAGAEGRRPGRHARARSRTKGNSTARRARPWPAGLGRPCRRRPARGPYRRGGGDRGGPARRRHPTVSPTPAAAATPSTGSSGTATSCWSRDPGA